MKRKEITKTFMMISNLKKTNLYVHGLYKNISRLEELKRWKELTDLGLAGDPNPSWRYDAGK